MIDKAILLAAGEGTRLRPFTYYTSKHLLPVFDRPMIFYPLTNLILMGVKTIFLIINGVHRSQWEALLFSLDLEVDIILVEQEKAEGIPQTIEICENFLCGEPFYLALGDNLLLGAGLLNKFQKTVNAKPSCSVIIGYRVNNPEEFGVAILNDNKEPIKIVEKPLNFVSDMAIVGLYKFDADACSIFKKLKKSERGEYEVCDLINAYIEQNRCEIVICDGANDYWLDTGTIDAITSASVYLRELKNNGVRFIGDLTRP